MALPSGMDSAKLSEIDAKIHESIAAGELPGAVLWVESQGEIYHRAYGARSLHPEREEMTRDTIFDVASLTKVMATAPAILHLHERGLLSIDDPVAAHIPEILEAGINPRAEPVDIEPTALQTLSIRQLLSHQSGLPPSISMMTREFLGYDEGVRRAASIGLIEQPGTRFRYSDVNYILLGEIIRRVSGQPLDVYTQEHIFGPLGMTFSTYQPPESLQADIAPTEIIDGYGPIRGEVHDPTCRRMRGVAGHAGVFSTAKDVAKFCRFFLNKGVAANGTRLLDAATIDLATRTHTADELRAPRGLGWDIGSPFAYQRGENFPHAGYGHTGWTGTSIWIDPASETFVILLANRNHPAEGRSIKSLRRDIGTLAAEAVGYRDKAPTPEPTTTTQSDALDRQQTAGGDPGKVQNGIDFLADRRFDLLRGLRVGLVTNHTGIGRERRRTTIDLLHESKEVQLVRLFSPEHGIRGTADPGEMVQDGRDPLTGLEVISLYKIDDRKPTAEQLADIDALVFDIQDIGCRYYTYVSTMGLAMEAAHQHGKTFIVLDRVNPIGGETVDGPVRTGQGNDFVAYHDIPIIHGMTVGELARMFRAERGLDGLDLKIVPLRGWTRDMRFDATGLPWINPSPNIRSLTEALLYPGVALLEFTNLSVGRGTPTPFEVVGAPWITEGRLAERLLKEKLPGVYFIPIRFTPTASAYKNEDCGGVRIVITDRDRMNAVDVGLALGRAIQTDYPETFTLDEKGNTLLRQPDTHAKWLQLKSNRALRRDWDKELRHFKKRRQEYLLY